MDKIKLGISEEEFERQFAEATRRGKERLRTEPRAKHAKYDARTRRIIIELHNGCTLLVPVDLMQGLRGATNADLADFTLMPRGFDLHWHKLDVQFTVNGLLKGLFGTKKWMAALNHTRNRTPKVIVAHANGQTRKQPRAATTAQPSKRRRSAA